METDDAGRSPRPALADTGKREVLQLKPFGEIPVSIVDVHHHIVSEPHYLDALLRRMDQFDVERVGLIAMGEIGRYIFTTESDAGEPATEGDVAAALQAHPDRFFGYIFIRPGFDGPEKIRRWAAEGFRGVKLHLPKDPYNHPAYWPLYEAACDAGLPCLFHTGIFCPPRPMPGQFISSENMRPILLDPGANDFPDLAIILAHMGVCYNDEVAHLARLLPNVHFEISGSVTGWRVAKNPAWWQSRLWWPTAHKKILFASDVHYDDLEPTIADQLKVIDWLDWDSAKRSAFLRDNALRLFYGDKP